jgi:uncharacterized phage-associated protein
MATATVHDVAAYILELVGRQTSTMKLQKLVYYSQAWSLVWDDRALFGERIEAWANGPVVPALYNNHRGQFAVSAWSAGDSSRLDAAAKETIRKVVAFYGDQTPQWLSDLTHMERPWREARAGLPDGMRGSNEIRLDTMSEYYSSIPPAQPA